MITPRCMDSVDGNGRVERQCQTEKPKEQAMPHTSAPFQKPADRERAKKSPDKHDHGDRVPLCFRQRTKHQTLSISEGRSLKQVLSRLQRGVPSARIGFQFVGAHVLTHRKAEVDRAVSCSMLNTGGEA